MRGCAGTGPRSCCATCACSTSDGSQTLFTTREGSVGLDLWNFFRTGQFVAGRVRLDGPRVTLVRLADGRIRLLGLRRASGRPAAVRLRPAARGTRRDRGRDRRVPRSHDRPAAARARRDSTAELRRDRDFVVHGGRRAAARGARHDASSSTCDSRVRSTIASTSTRASNSRSTTLQLAGLVDFVPAQFARPLGGRGPVRAVLATRAGRGRERCGSSSPCATSRLRRAGARRAADRGRAASPTRAWSSRRQLHAATRRSPRRWSNVRPSRCPPKCGTTCLRATCDCAAKGRRGRSACDELRVRTDAAPQPASHGASRGSGRGRTVSRFGLKLEAGARRPAATVAAGARARAACVRPLGRAGADGSHRRAARRRRTRERAGLPADVPAERRRARVRRAAARGRLPGVAGMTASVDGTEQRGTLALRCRTRRVRMAAACSAQPIRAERVTADIDVASRRRDLAARDAGARTRARAGAGHGSMRELRS